MKPVWCLSLLLFAAAPAAAQEREWALDTSADEAFLVFGVPESDDVGISLWCKGNSGEIRIFIPEAGSSLNAGKTAKLQIGVSGKTFDYDAEPSTNEKAATMSAEASTRASDPLFAALRESDRFTVKIGGEESAFPLAGADLDGLLRVCG